MPKNGNTVKKVYMWTVLAGSIYAGSSFIISMVTSNVMGTYAAGILAIAMTIGNQLLTIGYYDVRPFQVSDVTEQHSFSDYMLFRIISTAVMLLTGTVWLIIRDASIDNLIAIALVIIFKAGESISDLFEGRYQQKGRYDISCRGVVYKTVLYLVGFIVSMIITKSLLVALMVMSFLYWLSIIIIDSRLIPKFGKVKLKFRWQKQVQILSECAPLFINSFLALYILNASKYVVDSHYGEELLGVFNTLYMMAFVINLFASFVFKPLIVTLSEHHLRGEYAKFTRLIKRQVLVVIGIAIGCLVGTWFLGTQVLSGFSGIDLSPYRIELCIILVAGTFSALYQLFNFSIVIMRHQRYCLVASIITTILTAVITPLLVKRYALIGAAGSYLISMAVMALILAVFTIYFLKKKEVSK